MIYTTRSRPYTRGDTDSFKRMCQALGYQPLTCGDISCATAALSIGNVSGALRTGCAAAQVANRRQAGREGRAMTTFMTGFSGFGLADVGAMAAGWQHVGGVEFDAKIAAVYRQNIGPCHVGPIQDVDPKQYDGVDAMHFSPVCKNFSLAKTNGVEDVVDIETASAVAMFVTVCRPKYVTVENVRAYVGSKSYRVIYDALVECGYGIDVQIVDAANFGVPQNRIRMILRAVRGGIVPPLVPTHSEGGVGGLKPWRGWYAAVEDLIPTLEETRFAPWQLKRLQPLFDTMLVEGDAAGERDITCRSTDEPATTIRTASGGRVMRAYLLDGMNASRDYTVRCEDEPSVSVLSSVNRRPISTPTAFICDGQTNDNGGDMTVRADCEHRVTVSASMDKRPARAYLVGVNGETLEPREIPDPAPTITADHSPAKYRAWLERGRVVRMSARCLARFQSMPDWYELPPSNKLAGTGIGNGVPSLLFQRVCESLENATVDAGHKSYAQIGLDL